MKLLNEQYLINGLKSRNKIIFDFVFHYYYSGLCAYAERLVHDESAAEDIVQELFVTLWIKHEQIHITSSLKNYLFTSVKNRSLDYLKREQRKSQKSDNIIEEKKLSENLSSLWFTEAEKLGFTSGTSHELELHPEYRRIPLNYGNQPSMQTAFIFNKLGRYDLSQYWSGKVIGKAYSGLGTATGYNGDEDQGLMGSLNVLMKIGLFQMTGGTEEDPVYEITGPVFDEVAISLNPDYYPGETFVVKKQNQTDNYLIENITFNGNAINNFTIKHSEITNGGELILNMAP